MTRQLINISAAVFMAFFAGCNDRTTSVISPNGARNGAVLMSFAKAPAGVVQVVARLSRAGYNDQTLSLAVADSGVGASGSFTCGAVGTWRLKVDALNDSGAVQYSGEADIDVVSGQTTSVTLEL